MLLNKEDFYKAAREAQNMDGYIYVCNHSENCGGLKVEVNGAAPRTFANMNPVIKSFSPDEILTDVFYWKDQEWTLDQFIDWVNKKYEG